MTEPLVLIVIAALVALWYTGLRDREAALRAARAACERHELQLLDETVAVRRLRFARDANARMRVKRTFAFEFTGDSEHRRQGNVVLLGGRVVALTLDVDGTTLHDLAS